MERTCVIIKPDGVARKLIPDILKRLDVTKLDIVAMKLVRPNQALLRKHYSAHTTKPFYPGLERYILEGPVLAMVYQGDDAVAKVRKICGSTDPSKAEKGTIRGDLGKDSMTSADRENRSIKNLIHASGTKEEAETEIRLWFSKNEIMR